MHHITQISEEVLCPKCNANKAHATVYSAHVGINCPSCGSFVVGWMYALKELTPWEKVTSEVKLVQKRLQESKLRKVLVTVIWALVGTILAGIAIVLKIFLF